MEQLNPESNWELHTPSERERLKNEVSAALSDPNVDIELGPEKAWVALVIASVGSGLTAALGFVAADSPWFAAIVIAGAVLTPIGTALGVYAKRASIR